MPNLILIKQEALSPPRNFDLVTADELQIVFSNKVNLLFFPFDKVKVFAEVFPDLDNSSSYLFDNNNFKVDHVSVEMFKKVIITLDFSKASDLDYIQFVVLKKWGETVIPGHYLAFQIDLGPNL